MAESTFESVWRRREALEEHLERIGLRRPLQLLLLHLYETGVRDAGRTIRHASLTLLARELGCSVRGVTNWRDDLVAFGFIALLKPARGRTLITVVEWERVWSCDRVADAGPGAVAWVRANPPDDARDDARNAARHPARDAAPDPARHPARRDPVLILEEKEKNPSFLRTSDAAADGVGGGTATDGRKEGVLDSQKAAVAAQGGPDPLSGLSERLWAAETTEAAMYALLKAWWAEWRETGARLGWSPRVVLAGVLATRRTKPDLPLQYLRSCLRSPGAKWLEAADLVMARRKGEQTYAPHGVAR